MTMTDADLRTDTKYVTEPKGFVTGFTVIDHDYFGINTELTVFVYILPGYTGIQKGHYSEVMMHMGQSDRLCKFRFQTEQRLGHVAESVQLLTADGTHFSGPITRGEGGVYWEQHSDRYYHYLANPAGMLSEYCDRMSEIEAARECDRENATDSPEITEIETSFRADADAILTGLSDIYQLHPTVIRDICETAVRLLNSTPG